MTYVWPSRTVVTPGSLLSWLDQAYVERIVQPNLPDAPMEPRRMRGILATLILSLLAYGILRMLLAGVREHAQ